MTSTTSKNYSQIQSHRKEEENSSDVKLEGLITQVESKEEEKNEAKVERKAKKGRQCEDAKPPSKKKFLEIGLKQICAMPYTREWKLESSPKGRPEKSSKLRKSAYHERPCPRELDDYVKSLWIPFCKPKEKPLECRDPIDPTVCIFCLESLYVGGYLHDLLEKVPAIKKQSEIYGDEVSWRIGIRTRVTVHKNCYDLYIDTFTHKAEEENEIDIDLANDDIEQSEDLSVCGEEEEEEEKQKQKEKEEMEKQSENLRKRNFCLQKFKIPKIEPDSRSLSF